MRHFIQLAQVNVIQLCQAIQFADDLWDADRRLIVLRDASAPFEPWRRLPIAQKMVYDLMGLVGATRLGDVTIERLPPGEGTAITSGSDKALVRHEIVLQNLPGATAKIEDEELTYETGQIWAWRAARMERWNGSKDDQISLLAALETA